MRFFLGVASIVISAATVLATNTCTANGLAGSCISTASCTANGGTSTANLCPNDPNGILCCTYGTCVSGGLSGSCISTSSCTGTSVAGLCPGPSTIECCVPTAASCTVSDGRTGKCVNTASCSATSVAGYCAGASNIQCCVSGTAPSTTFNAATVLAAARSSIGIPYVWGGGHSGTPGASIGTCSGYTGSILPCPADHTVGFDCSGLVRYALWKGTGIDLASGGNTNSQYASSRVTHITYAERQPGDIEFFGTVGNLYHVIMYSGKNSAGADMMLEAQQTGTNVHEVALRTGGLWARVR